MTAPFRLTTPTRLVLTVLLAADGPAWGLQLAEATGLGTGTLYPILARLHAHGWTTVHTETGPHPGRPARQMHQFTDHGREQAGQAIDTAVSPHRYLSTGCLHGEHAYCQGKTGLAGAKVPASCKFCGAPCQCPCRPAAGE